MLVIYILDKSVDECSRVKRLLYITIYQNILYIKIMYFWYALLFSFGSLTAYRVAQDKSENSVYC